MSKVQTWYKNGAKYQAKSLSDGSWRVVIRKGKNVGMGYGQTKRDAIAAAEYDLEDA